jgi:hypothetical protein
MNEPTPSPELEDQIRAALAAPDPPPAFVRRLQDHLIAQAAAPQQARPVPRMRLAWAWIFAGLLILALAGFAVGPANLVAAMQRLLGYIPGIGLVVDGEGLRFLAEPVSMTRDGITLTVTQVILDSEQTIVIYTADGIPPQAYPANEEATFCPNDPRLRLPDGILLTAGSGIGGGWGSGFESRMIFPALPADADQAVFELPCLMDTAPGAAPQDWELPLRFVPAPPELTIVPVIDVTPEPGTAALSESSADMGLFLEQVIELEDSYILIGTFRQGEALPGAMVMGPSTWPEITTASGLAWAFKLAADIQEPSTDMGTFPWAYQIGKGFAAPLTIRIEAVDAEFPAAVTFALDVGPDPQPGQEWILNQELEVAGHTLTLMSAVLNDGERENGYEFFFRSNPEVSGVSVEDPTHPTVGGYGGGSLGEFSAGLVYDGPVPTGRLTYRITHLTARHAGPWTLEWSPPASSPSATPLAIPSACLTLETWQQAAANPAPLPEGLGGRLIAYGRIVDDGQPLSPDNAGVFLVDLDGGNRRPLGPGTWPALTQDGRRAAYGWTDGLHVVDLDRGQDSIVPGTLPSDYGPRWSPDGTQLAFVRVEDLNLYRVDPDGSALRQLTDGPEYELLLGWLPDGTALYYAVPGPDGLTLRFLDLVNGVTTEGLVLNAKGASAAISPDGERIAFIERLPGSMDIGLYLARLDGTQRQLVAQLGHWGLSNPIWSPDGDWLMVSFQDADLPDAATATALLDPMTCQVIPLDGIDGTVQGWAPQ